MNHLAHFWLADDDPLHRLGVALGDFWRGGIPPHWPERLRDGLAWHREVDRLTDSHPESVRVRQLFQAPHRRFAPILLDLWCDHWLARELAADDDLRLGALSRDYLASLGTAIAEMTGQLVWPDHFERFVAWLGQDAVLPGYRHPTGIQQALRGISRRLSRTNPVADSWPLLVQHQAELDELARILLFDLRQHRQAGTHARIKLV
ncbi:ACP phosphodiesterase [Ahniella affigens]|uniref:acyl carrier protein phosphodiesterase n=1 Tax=Ahniella affigens TaxID=2021234 RepID=UPI001475F51E|nr:ACP phosphodiesterase [Ahniella affigens]